MMINFERCLATNTSMTNGRILLDTNVLFWHAFDTSQLTQRAVRQLADVRTTLLVSPVSMNELSIKSSKGKLVMPKAVGEWVSEFMVEFDASELPLTHEHASRIEFLPWHHRDPFDRLLIAQALAEDVPVLSSDRVFDAYGVARIW